MKNTKLVKKVLGEVALPIAIGFSAGILPNIAPTKFLLTLALVLGGLSFYHVLRLSDRLGGLAGIFFQFMEEQEPVYKDLKELLEGLKKGAKNGRTKAHK